MYIDKLNAHEVLHQEVAPCQVHDIKVHSPSGMIQQAEASSEIPFTPGTGIAIHVLTDDCIAIDD